jgi:hypothetical protein
MKYSTALKKILGFTLIFSLFISSSVLAGDPLITASFSGIWDQPEQESQGIILQIGEQLDEKGIEKKIGIAYWFTYGPDLQTSWYLGVGEISGHQIDMVLYTASEIGFMAANIEGDVDDEGVTPVGTMLLDFKNCNHGIASYEFFEGEQGLESGEFPIKRISSIYRQRCSGGISDDTPAGGKPLQMDVRLLPMEEDGVGEGKAKLWERSDRSDFKVEVEDIPDGAYLLQICADHDDAAVDMVEFEIEVFGGEGELEFRSPEIDDKLNLNFDPRGCKIEVFKGDFVVLTSGDLILSEKVQGQKDDDSDSDGKIKLEADFTSTGVIADAKGEAEFELKSGHSELSVKIKNVPAGLYALHINGVNNGDIEVLEDDGDFEGKAKFTSPLKEGTLELLEDPRGQLIEVRQNAVEDAPVILEILFPSD